VATERAILTAIWHMLTDGTFYQDPGPDYYLTSLGYQVTLVKAA
jgi:hypothetical protein